MGLFYVMQKISIPNYPAKFFWVNLMPFVNVTLWLTLKERGKLARFPVFVFGVCFHSLLLKFSLLAEHC